MKITVLTATRTDEIDVTNNCKNAVLTITSTILVTYLESILENNNNGQVDYQHGVSEPGLLGETFAYNLIEEQDVAAVPRFNQCHAMTPPLETTMVKKINTHPLRY